VGEVAKDPDKKGRKADSRSVHSPRRLDSRSGFEELSVVSFPMMAAVQTGVPLCSHSWQRPLYIYGGLACNSLMAGKFCLLSFLAHSGRVTVVYE